MTESMQEGVWKSEGQMPAGCGAGMGSCVMAVGSAFTMLQPDSGSFLFKAVSGSL